MTWGAKGDNMLASSCPPARSFRVVAAVAVVALLAGMAGRAGAHESPAGCEGNGIGGGNMRSASTVANGGTVSFTASVSNTGIAAPCDLTDATVKLCCPGADGQPASTDCPAGEMA